MIPRGVSYLTSTFDRKDLFHNPDRQVLLDLRETASAGYRRTYGISKLRQWINHITKIPEFIVGGPTPSSDPQSQTATSTSVGN